MTGVQVPIYDPVDTTTQRDLSNARAPPKGPMCKAQVCGRERFQIVGTVPAMVTSLATRSKMEKMRGVHLRELIASVGE